ncbi:MAG: hypothetical protein U0031_07095 [Thermomicrobiales bacterium]
MVEIGREPFGAFDGQPVTNYHLSNRYGLRVEILTYGGVIRAVWAPDRAGTLANVALGFGDLAGYRRNNSPFFGCITGRYANASPVAASPSMAKPVWPATSATTTCTAVLRGFDKFVWDADEVHDSDSAGVHSPGPARTARRVSRRVAHVGDLSPRRGEQARDRLPRRNRPANPILNLTNHAYWNLAGRDRQHRRSRPLARRRPLHPGRCRAPDSDRGPGRRWRDAVRLHHANGDRRPHPSERIRNY